MDRRALLQRLRQTFLDELEVHGASLGASVLALERAAAAEPRAAARRDFLRAAHSLKGAARAVAVQPVEQLCHALEDALERAPAAEPLARPQIALLLAAVDVLSALGSELRAGRDPDPAAAAAMVEHLRTGTAAPVVAARADSVATTVRVAASRLDALLATSGEMLLAHHRTLAWRGEVEAARDLVRQCVGGGDGVAERLQRLERTLARMCGAASADGHVLEQTALRLAEQVREVRLVPFAEACQTLERTVRDLATASGKEVALEIAGGACEVDRSVLERLRAPLVHLVRNALDHGVELPAERTAAGKPACARITVSAVLRGHELEVEVADDGRGVEVERIRSVARARGLPEPATDAEALELLFAAGFSTAAAVTEVSGRGVGLDVVRAEVEALHGRVEVQTERGRGTRFVLASPLTLTRIRALLVHESGRTFALPATNVERLLTLTSADVSVVDGRRMVRLGDSLVPLLWLGEALDGSAQAGRDSRLSVVVVRAAGRRAALVVGAFAREDDVTVQSLGTRLASVRRLAGAAVLAGGQVAFILNAAELVRCALDRRNDAAAAPVRGARRLLLADDSMTVRAVQRAMLQAAGYEVVTAADGADALRLLHEGGADLVISDVEMPRMDGFQLTRAIRGSRTHAAVPVILVTSRADEADRKRGLEAGASAYIVKSGFDADDLLRTIAQLG